MSAAVAILDALRKKPLAEKKKEYSVAFFVANSTKPKGMEKKKKKKRKHQKEKKKKKKENTLLNTLLNPRRFKSRINPA